MNSKTQLVLWLIVLVSSTIALFQTIATHRNNYIFPKDKWGAQTNTAVLEFQGVANVNMYPKTK